MVTVIIVFGVMVGWMTAEIIEKFKEVGLGIFLFAVVIFIGCCGMAISHSDQVSEDDLFGMLVAILLFLIGCGVGWLVSGNVLSSEAWWLLLVMVLFCCLGLVGWSVSAKKRRQKSKGSLRSIDWRAFAKIERQKVRRVADYECEACDK
jgi:putative effector of murein hydrolase LrgA (UPF0299 family)